MAQAPTASSVHSVQCVKTCPQPWLACAKTSLTRPATSPNNTPAALPNSRPRRRSCWERRAASIATITSTPPISTNRGASELCIEFVVSVGRTSRNSAKPDQVTTSQIMVRRGGHRRSRPARIKTAKTLPLTITGCTSARSPWLSATACNPNATALSPSPISYDGRRTRRSTKPVLDSSEAEEALATRCCSADPPARQAAEANAATTANSTTNLLQPTGDSPAILRSPNGTDVHQRPARQPVRHHFG